MTSLHTQLPVSHVPSRTITAENCINNNVENFFLCWAIIRFYWDFYYNLIMFLTFYRILNMWLCGWGSVWCIISLCTSPLLVHIFSINIWNSIFNISAPCSAGLFVNNSLPPVLPPSNPFSPLHYSPTTVATLSGELLCRDTEHIKRCECITERHCIRNYRNDDEDGGPPCSRRASRIVAVVNIPSP